MLASVSWAWFVAAVVLAAVLGLPLLILCGFGISLLVGKARRVVRRRRGASPQLQYVYYVDDEGIRSLAAGLQIDLPLTRQVTRTRRLAGSWRGLTGEQGRSETSEFAAAIDLNRLAEQVGGKTRPDDFATDLQLVPYVRDVDLLNDVTEQLEKSFGETSKTRDVLTQLRTLYESEKSEAVLTSKRAELAQVAGGSKTIFLRGQLEPLGEPASVRLAALEEVRSRGVRRPANGRRRRPPSVRRSRRYVRAHRDLHPAWGGHTRGVCR
jgi:hypothetical protein